MKQKISLAFNLLLPGFVLLVLAASVMTMVLLYNAGLSINPVYIAVFIILTIGGYAIVAKAGMPGSRSKES